MQKMTGLLLSFAAAALVVVGFVVLVSNWIESRFGPVWVVAIWAALGLCVAMFVGVLIAGMVQRWTLNGLVDFQAADDRGEIARANTMREIVRGANQYEKDLRRLAMPIAKQQALAMQERYALQAERKQGDTGNSWYQLPDGGDE